MHTASNRAANAALGGDDAVGRAPRSRSHPINHLVPIMSMFSNDTLTQRALAILRIVTAFLLIQHGTAKLFGFPHQAFFDNLQVLSLIGIAGVIELVGSALLLIGLFARPVAFILSGEMAFAYFIGHAPKGSVLMPQLNGGESAVLFCFIFLFIAAAGAGAWSVDAARVGKR